NNQLVQLAEDETAEIFRILGELTERLRQTIGPLEAAAGTIAQLDSIFARGRFAREFDACIPQFSESAELRLDLARHPVLEDKLRRENRAIVPISLALSGQQRLLVISGPNTGGKTVALKTTGIAALSAQSGIPVGAQRAVLPLFDCVLVDIGDEQSIAADLSTFSAHMLNLKSMVAEATPSSLVLVDEIGTGTAPEEGAALAEALLDEFHKKNCFVLATTHHDRLKTYASTTPGVVNAAVEFDDINLRPTYRLMLGVPGGSSGIAIAERLGLSEPVIRRARELMTPESEEAADLIAYLHRSRDELDRLREQMADERQALERERQKLRAEWVDRQKRRIAQLEQRAGRQLRGVRGEAKDQWNAAVVQTIAESQQDLGLKTESADAINLASLQSGTKIRVRGFNKPVIFRRLDGSSLEIEAGPLRMKVARDEVTGLAKEAPPGTVAIQANKRDNVSVTSESEERGSSRNGEINVIGMTVEQASELVDKYIDESVLASRPRIRIIHGHGTGALRRGLAEFLKTHPSVAQATFETEERGGKAVTVVELRL